MVKDKTSYQLAVEAVKKDSVETRRVRIQNLFRQVGSMFTHRFVDECLEQGIFTELDYAAAKYAVLGKITREALGDNDESRMPFAGQSTEQDEDGQVVWKQRGFWEVPDYRLNINDRIADRDANHVVAVRLAAECQRRFHERIAIPALPSRKAAGL